MAALAGVTDRPSPSLRQDHGEGGLPPNERDREVALVMPLLGSLRLLARLPSVDETTLRALRGVVDAVIVESDVYLSTSFESLREELDP